jgi:hypothetical protein
VKRYILTVADSFDPNKTDLSDIDVVSVEELTTCRDCEFYGRAYPKYCELIDKYIPTYFFCNFAKPEPAGTDETFFYVDNIKL